MWSVWLGRWDFTSVCSCRTCWHSQDGKSVRFEQSECVWGQRCIFSCALTMSICACIRMTTNSLFLYSLYFSKYDLQPLTFIPSPSLGADDLSSFLNCTHWEEIKYEDVWPPAVYSQHWSNAAALIIISSSDPCLGQVLECAKVEAIDQRVCMELQKCVPRREHTFIMPPERDLIFGRRLERGSVMLTHHVLNLRNRESCLLWNDQRKHL